MQDCYCINPSCPQPAHPNNNNPKNVYCASCGSQLLLNGKYRVSRLLSNNSGFGIVYEAFKGFKAKILKVLQERWNDEAKAIELFKREYDILVELSRQGITGVPKGEDYFEYQTREGKTLHCLVMEKVEGIDLEQWVNQYDKISQKQALKWLKEIVLILDKIHQNNWFHRDIKPPNIMMRNNGELVLIDFGTAREETQTYYQKIQGQQVTGIVSAGYTPNEQQYGQSVMQSDFFALGRTFVHLLTGKSPSELYDAIHDILNWREETENIHPLLLDFVEELMARLPNDRPNNTQVILQRLNEIEQQLNQANIRQNSSPAKVTVNPSPVVSPLAETVVQQSVRPTNSNRVKNLNFSPDLPVDLNKQKYQNIKRSFFLKWTFIYIIGLVLMSLFGIYQDPDFVFFATPFTLALVVGSPLFLLLKKYLRLSFWWIILTAIGCSFFSLFLMIPSLIICLIQWRMLKKYLHFSSWWILPYTLTYGLSSLSVVFIITALSSGDPYAWVIGIVIGIVTGIIKGWLMSSFLFNKQNFIENRFNHLSINN